MLVLSSTRRNLRISIEEHWRVQWPRQAFLFVLHGVLFFVLLPLRTTLRARDPEVLLVRIWFSQTNQACLGVKYELLGFLDFTHVQAATKNAAAALSDGGHIVKKDDLRERDAGPGRRELL
ncbi:hypothetical protein T4A_4182 [Trichinella pseudospiralis]|uniref:Uncharacterized protein n=1 Tax=Trichinella pseudospiralis TaxID=6337 RepID=A0A0V1ESJ6_TRIPS|nr:hypothetical protein T4A_4182 [Trichinella pseudospiralis]KRY82695.1 hypothetical protein T4D_9529 [Trichinella pseudospiralis]KRZ29258.1 hypothetical protein T4C_7672 [Trichinella pseudospiralis]